MRKILLMLSLLAGLNVAFADNAAADNAPIKANVDYTTIMINAAKPSKSKKINVKEFFSFTCYHCKLTEPFLQAKLVNNKNIDLQRIQVNFGGDTYAGFAKIAATLNNLKDNAAIYALYPKVFDAVYQVEASNGDVKAYEKQLSSEQGMRKFLTDNKISKKDQDTFMNVFNSFTISSKVAEFTALTAKYNVTETPTFIVGDQYLVSAAQPPRTISVVNQLVNMMVKNK